MPFTCRASIPGVRVRKGRGFRPGFHLIGGRGSSIWATVHSCFASLHSAKATGRPRSTWLLALSGEDVLELDVTQKCLRFGDEIVDRLVTVADAALDDDLGHARRRVAPTRQRPAEPRLLPASTLPAVSGLRPRSSRPPRPRSPAPRRSGSARIPHRRHRSSRNPPKSALSVSAGCEPLISPGMSEANVKGTAANPTSAHVPEISRRFPLPDRKGDPDPRIPCSRSWHAGCFQAPETPAGTSAPAARSASRFVVSMIGIAHTYGFVGAAERFTGPAVLKRLPITPETSAHVARLHVVRAVTIVSAQIFVQKLVAVRMHMLPTCLTLRRAFRKLGPRRELRKLEHEETKDGSRQLCCFPHPFDCLSAIRTFQYSAGSRDSRE